MSDLELVLLLAACFVAGFFVVSSVISASRDRPRKPPPEGDDR
jgi:hypothetical protein